MTIKVMEQAETGWREMLYCALNCWEYFLRHKADNQTSECAGKTSSRERLKYEFSREIPRRKLFVLAGFALWQPKGCGAKWTWALIAK